MQELHEKESSGKTVVKSDEDTEVPSAPNPSYGVQSEIVRTSIYDYESVHLPNAQV